MSLALIFLSTGPAEEPPYPSLHRTLGNHDDLTRFVSDHFYLGLPRIRSPPVAAENKGGGGGGGAKKALSREEEILKLIKAGDRNGAILKAIELYNLDVSAIKGTPAYDKLVSGEGLTSPDGKVTIGDDAFSSPGWLASSIGHEALHAAQLQDGRWNDHPESRGLNEVEAYDYEIANASQNGLSDKEVAELTSRREAEYKQLPQSARDRVDNGDYTPPAKGDK